MNVEWIDEQNDLAGKVVLVRAGLNTPIEKGVVRTDFRIRKAIPTLRFLRDQGARVIVIAHIGRDKNETLQPVADALNEYFPVRFQERKDLDVSTLQNGDITLLENLRQDNREVAGDETLAQELAALADVFVQDAFSVCHRNHASIVGIPKYIKSYGGLLVREETEKLASVLQPEHPALFILGGAKFGTKEPLIRKFMGVYDSVFIGGALQNELLAARGIEVGASVIDDGEVAKDILENEKVADVHDVIVEHVDGSSETLSINQIGNEDTIVDIGEGTMQNFVATFNTYKTIVWNGPLGWYEKGYISATKTCAQTLALSSATTVVGGGDTIALIQKEKLENEFDFVSTGGGAMLEFLLKGTLPGLEVLK
ncbi:phosphoglycerate kinase [Candidatus Kaiserbacteria bacterium]|nr:MAG: phosphoglycerate kinase [Candidatus Kaiserbacteria bacterium]